jgi:hypothetical protein
MAQHRSVTVIGIILLLWNLMGILAFTMQYSMDLDVLAQTDPLTAQAFATMPGWLWVVYAIAVGAGTIGALLLLARRALAAVLFLLSLLCVLVQFGYTFLGTDLIAIKGFVIATAFPAFVILMAIVQLLYTRHLIGKSILR